MRGTTTDPNALNTRWLVSRKELGLVSLNDVHRDFTVIHPCELDNPGDFMEPGSIVLLTGLGFQDRPERFTDYVRSAQEAGIVGIGFGIGVYFDQVPAELITAADDAALALFSVPLPTPFVSVLAAVYKEQDERRMRVHNDLLVAHERLNLAARRGIDELMASCSDAIGGHMALVDSEGTVRTLHSVLDVPALAADDIEKLVAEHGSGVATRAGELSVLLHRMQRAGTGDNVLVAARVELFDSYARMILRHCAGLAELLLQRPASLRGVRKEINALAMAIQLGWKSGPHSIARVFADVADAQGQVRPAVLYSDSARVHEKALAEFDRVMVISSRHVYALRIDDVSSLIFFRGTRSVEEIKKMLRLGTSRLAVGVPRAWWEIDSATVNELVRLATSARPGDLAAPDDSTLAWARDEAVQQVLRERNANTWGRLRAVDAERGGQLAATLEAYLRLNGNVSYVADALRIHRQTVTKRLALISDVIEADIADPLVRADLLVAAHALG